jgi:transposase-like protein
MPRKGHSEEKIVYALRQVEAGKKVTEVCREMGVSPQAFYSWKRRYAGGGLNELRELRQLHEEGPQTEDAGGGSDARQAHTAGGAVKKSLKPAARRELVGSIRHPYQLNESRACGLVGITRWINQYQSRRDPQDELRQRLRDLAGNRPRYGYRRLTVMLRREGWQVNAKRVYRIYRE